MSAPLTDMNAALTDLVSSIVQAHESATEAMRGVVAHAVRAGELLAKVKAALPHGSFGDFCAGLPFGATTARGYMRLAALDPAKRQRVADLPLRTALLEIAEAREVKPQFSALGQLLLQPGADPPPFSEPAWTPTTGHWHMCAVGGAAFHVVPCLAAPDRFHISKLYHVAPDDSRWDGTIWPVPGYAVETHLQHHGLADPSAAPWHSREHPGMAEPFAKPEGGDD